MNYLIIIVCVLIIFIVADQMLKLYLGKLLNKINNTLENFLDDGLN